MITLPDPTLVGSGSVIEALNVPIWSQGRSLHRVSHFYSLGECDTTFIAIQVLNTSQIILMSICSITVLCTVTIVSRDVIYHIMLLPKF
jgi:hypothetical protein